MHRLTDALEQLRRLRQVLEGVRVHELDSLNVPNLQEYNKLLSVIDTEAYDIPDIDLLKFFYEYTTVRLPQTKVGSAKVTFNTGVTQGSVLSPLLFSLFINALSRYLDDIGCKEKVSHGLPNIAPFCHILFADDMTLLAQNETKIQQLMNDATAHERLHTKTNL